MTRKREAFEKARAVTEDDLRPMSGMSPYPSPVKRGESFCSPSPELVVEGQWRGWRMKVPDEGGKTVLKTFWEQRISSPEAGSFPAKTSSIIDATTARDHENRSKSAARSRRLFSD